MIAAWMATVTLFTLLLGAAAVAAERALRTLGRQGRAPWLVALAAAFSWPMLAPLADALLPEAASTGAPNPFPGATVTIVAITSTLPSVPDGWSGRVDAVLVSLWIAVSVALLVRLALALRTLEAVERAATREIVAGVPVLVTAALGPAVFGVRRPRLLVPRWLLGLETPLQALVVRHEEEHCRARDPQVALAVAVALALVPWNVGAWWIARRLRLAMELDCDARVLRVAQDTVRYGRLLLFIAQRQAHTNVATMLAESTSDLSRRITVMNTPRPHNARTRAALLALAAAGALACSAKYGTDLARTPAESRPPAGDPQQAVATYFAPEGSKPASPLAGSGYPVYPEALRRARVEGEVVAAFVVDTSGLVLPGSLRVVRSSDPQFVDAVRAALPTMRFDPPEANGRRVRQLVQQHFRFAVAGSAASAARPAPPTPRPTSDPTNRNPMPLPPVVITVP